MQFEELRQNGGGFLFRIIGFDIRRALSNGAHRFRRWCRNGIFGAIGSWCQYDLKTLASLLLYTSLILVY